MEDTFEKKFTRAQKRVGAIKQFYQHLSIYLVANVLLIGVKFLAMDYFTENGIGDAQFIDWLAWNFIGTPVLWGIGLFVHGIYVFRFKAKPWTEFKPKFIKDWELRQIEKYMRNDK